MYQPRSSLLTPYEGYGTLEKQPTVPDSDLQVIRMKRRHHTTWAVATLLLFASVLSLGLLRYLLPIHDGETDSEYDTQLDVEVDQGASD